MHSYLYVENCSCLQAANKGKCTLNRHSESKEREQCICRLTSIHVAHTNTRILYQPLSLTHTHSLTLTHSLTHTHSITNEHTMYIIIHFVYISPVFFMLPTCICCVFLRTGIWSHTHSCCSWYKRTRLDFTMHCFLLVTIIWGTWFLGCRQFFQHCVVLTLKYVI